MVYCRSSRIGNSKGIFVPAPRERVLVSPQHHPPLAHPGQRCPVETDKALWEHSRSVRCSFPMLCFSPSLSIPPPSQAHIHPVTSAVCTIAHTDKCGAHGRMTAETEEVHGAEVPFSDIIVSCLSKTGGSAHGTSLDKDYAGVPVCPHPDCLSKVFHATAA